MKETLKNGFYMSLIIKSLIIIIGISGIIVTVNMGSFMVSYNAFLYYTIQSNMVVIIIAAIFLCLHYLENKNGKSYINNNLLLAKFSLTVAITVTFLVFFILLAPTMSPSYLLSFDNFSVHLIVPLLAIVDFFLFDNKINLSGFRPMVGLAMPLYYLNFALVLSLFEVSFHGEIVPYFFMNYEKLGWAFEKSQIGVAFWVIILCVLIIVLSYLFTFVSKMRNNK